jgi:histidine triad (HIT) family protein
MNCIFCDIIQKKIPATIIKETDDIVVIKDINPKAPIHYLIIPKKHIESVQEFAQEDQQLAGSLLLMAKQLQQDLDGGGFRLHINSGKDVGQLVPHLHVHFLAGSLSPIEL